MAVLLFGTGGIPHSTAKPKTLINGIKRISELGLGCMELEFTYGVRTSELEAEQIGITASKARVRLSAHAPYYINLNAHENDKLIASQDRLMQTARIGSICGASDIAFHPAFYMKDDPVLVFDRVKKILKGVADELKRQRLSVLLRPELMGKISQFGSLEEIVNISSEIQGVAPCIDFAHLHARTGKYNSYYEFKSALNLIEKKLGKSALDNMHIHLSGINYNARTGELSHLNIRESDFNFTELMQALKDTGIGGIIICESPNLEEDALFLQQTYSKV